MHLQDASDELEDPCLDGSFVIADWLQERLGKPGLSIIDASWYLPAHKRDARAEYEAGHIPGALFFDHDDVVDPDSDLPHTLPPPGDVRAHGRLDGHRCRRHHRRL